MRVLFISTIDKLNMGIFIKISNQSKSISELVGRCDLIYFNDRKICMDEYKSDTLMNTYEEDKKNIQEYSYRKNIYRMQKFALNTLNNKKYDYLYFRDQYFSWQMIKIMYFAKKNMIKIYMEIPTYPYYIEQYNVAKKKWKALISCLYYFLGDRFYFGLCDKIAVILSNSSKKIRPNMISIYNAVNTYDFDLDENTYKDSKKLYILGVGHIYPYHGFDRVIKSIDNYYKKNGKVNIEFHIVGTGDELDLLKKMVVHYHLESHVFFEGIKIGKELQDIYNITDISVGTLCLYKRGADIETAIKVSESLYQGIPVITSGKVAYYRYVSNMVFLLPNDDTVFDINKIINFVNNYDKNKADIKNIQNLLQWKNILEKLFCEI